MRGEYDAHNLINNQLGELPPRARRILTWCFVGFLCRGTTSACAENTGCGTPASGGSRNYLRVRGEYWAAFPVRWREMELPPRARRIRKVFCGRTVRRGTTSACAENTPGVLWAGGVNRNYLRVRGEYATCNGPAATPGELPPRARRIPAAHEQKISHPGTTSACAENT